MLRRRTSPGWASTRSMGGRPWPRSLAKITNHLDHHLRFLYTKRANLGVALAPRYTAR